MKSENYITIQGWMRTELDLKGNDLLVYAVIYGFSQTENQAFTGGLQYLADWCGATKQGVLKNIKNLLDRNLITKQEEYINNVKSVKYYATKFNGVLNIVERGIKHSLTNNINNTKIDTEEALYISKEDIYNSDFPFGSTKNTSKNNLYTECLAMINNATDDKQVRAKAKMFLDSILEQKKLRGRNQFKGILNKLVTYADGNITKMKEILDYSIEHGYATVYDIEHKQKKNVANNIEKIDYSHINYTDEEWDKIKDVNYGTF